MDVGLDRGCRLDKIEETVKAVDERIGADGQGSEQMVARGWPPAPDDKRAGCKGFLVAVQMVDADIDKLERNVEVAPRARATAWARVHTPDAVHDDGLRHGVLPNDHASEDCLRSLVPAARKTRTRTRTGHKFVYNVNQRDTLRLATISPIRHQSSQ